MSNDIFIDIFSFDEFEAFDHCNDQDIDKNILYEEFYRKQDVF